jgi:hypothetical protein
MFANLWYNRKNGGDAVENCKEKIIDFIEGRAAPKDFYIWLESAPRYSIGCKI